MTILHHQHEVNFQRRNQSIGELGFRSQNHRFIAVSIGVDSKELIPIMTPDPIEQRREQIAALSMTGEVVPVGEHDWKTTIGMFDDSSVIKEISEAGRAIRVKQRTE